MKGFAVIFDMDGVMVENISYHVEALNVFCERHGCSFTDEEFKTYLSGKTVNEVMRFIFRKELSEDEIKKYANEKEEIYRTLYKPFLLPTKGLIGFLEMLKTNNIPVGVATAGPQENVDFVLNGLDIRKYFYAVINGDMVVNGKPNPEIYLKAAEKLGAEPARCIVFEDSLSGIQSALNAGMKVIGITTVHKKEELLMADNIIKDFENLKIDDLIRLNC
jgi:beta-phosphoglucomutase family hydrolase